MAEPDQREADAGRKIVFSYGFVRDSDMEAKMKKFVLELCVSNLEKYSDNSLCAQIIKDALDKNYGGAGYWNVVVNCCYDEGSKMLVYFGGTMGAFIWKCSI